MPSGGKILSRNQKAIDDLRKSEERYRLLFEKNPLPMWVSESATEKILAVNQAAVAHYGYSKKEFCKLSVPDLAISSRKPSVHRKRDGVLIEVEMTHQEIQWEGAEVMLTMILDVTKHRHHEQERVRGIERFEGELANLKSLGNPNQALQNSSRQVVASNNRLMSRLTAEYEAILEEGIEQKVFKTDTSLSPRLQAMGSLLANHRATPRDVVQLHYQALKKVAPTMGLPKTQAYMDVGRITIIELMGYLAAAYRAELTPRKTKKAKPLALSGK